MATAEAATPPSTAVMPFAPKGWEVFTHPTLGYSAFYPSSSILESSDPGRYTLVVGPIEGHEQWPWFNVAHPDEADDQPPADADLQAWLYECNRPAGKVVRGRVIAGETAVHTRNDVGPQAYDDNRFYVVHDGQVDEITILHAAKEDWTIYDVFLDSFRF